MGHKRDADPEWREFERIVSRIEQEAGPLGIQVKSPDRIRSIITGRLREVDVSIRSKVGTSDVLITVECRRRKPKQDVTWIEQIASKRHAIGASRTIAVSPAGFSSDAQTAAHYYGIDLRTLRDFSIEDINKLIRLDFVLFTKRYCSIAGLRTRSFRELSSWTVPKHNSYDWTAPPGTDPYGPLFTNVDTGRSWSINDLWHDLQQATNPFAGIVVNEPPVVRSVCFPYPGNVRLNVEDGHRMLGDAVLSVALSTKHEAVMLDDAKKVEYSSPNGEAIQRIEFDWKENAANSCRIALQIPTASANASEVKISVEPKYERPSFN